MKEYIYMTNEEFYDYIKDIAIFLPDISISREYHNARWGYYNDKEKAFYPNKVDKYTIVARRRNLVDGNIKPLFDCKKGELRLATPIYRIVQIRQDKNMALFDYGRTFYMEDFNEDDFIVAPKFITYNNNTKIAVLDEDELRYNKITDGRYSEEYEPEKAVRLANQLSLKYTLLRAKISDMESSDVLPDAPTDMKIRKGELLIV